MALKDRFRRVVTRSSQTTRSNSSSSSTTSSPISPTLSKTTSRLSKRLTWGSRSNTAKAEEKKREDWDEEKAYIGAGGKHRDVLKGFEWKWRSSMDGNEARRSLSLFGGVSPMQSRVGSVDDTHVASKLGRRRSSAGSGAAGLQRVTSGGKEVETVIEE